ncbi:MAG TPA: creatininase family protein [Rectinemataceae bacterium]|nr:creatininase family protein [Rectinemataceae bacterium]
MQTSIQATQRRVDRMTSPQFTAALRRYSTLILPLGSVEQTGAHCPLGTDLFVAEKVSELLAEKADCLAAPPLPYSDTFELDFWPGNVHVDSPVLGSYLGAVARSFLRQGFANIVFLCCHSLDMKTVDLLCRRLHREGIGVCAIDWWKAAAEAARGETSSQEPFGHGGEVITSIMLALKPELVDLDRATDEDSLPGLKRISSRSLGSPFVAYGDFREYCQSGSWGEVRKTASADKGRRWLEKAVDNAASFIGECASNRDTPKQR